MRFDLVLDGGNFITLVGDRPRAGSVGIIGDRIVAVGERGELSGYDAGRTIDVGGLTVVPGFNDAHNHMQFFGSTLAEVPLQHPLVQSVDDIVAAVATRVAATPAGEWIAGARYDHNKLAERRHPTRFELDRVSPDHPVVLNHTS